MQSYVNIQIVYFRISYIHNTYTKIKYTNTYTKTCSIVHFQILLLYSTTRTTTRTTTRKLTMRSVRMFCSVGVSNLLQLAWRTRVRHANVAKQLNYTQSTDFLEICGDKSAGPYQSPLEFIKISWYFQGFKFLSVVYSAHTSITPQTFKDG